MCCTTETKPVQVETRESWKWLATVLEFSPFECESDALAYALRKCHNLDVAQSRQCEHIQSSQDVESAGEQPFMPFVYRVYNSLYSSYNSWSCAQEMTYRVGHSAQGNACRHTSWLCLMQYT